MDMGSLLLDMRRRWSLQQILWNPSHGQALHSQTPWLSPATTASHKRMASAHSLSPHKGFSLLSLILSFDFPLMCTVEIVCDFVCPEWGFDLAFNMGLEMRWSLWWQFVEESWVLEQISVRKAKTCWVF